ncbi:hypothetical protein FGO68_gene7244 [Halteria grandinella]|uniref:Uncharacterized protein n=1 Tax=Halteria grandinella TaxID=5974 RepID=A0A8J8SWF2_HALGN|nr:hypothetical protein FGO68_gene7244 [Halteria grandinella]
MSLSSSASLRVKFIHSSIILAFIAFFSASPFIYLISFFTYFWSASTSWLRSLALLIPFSLAYKFSSNSLFYIFPIRILMHLLLIGCIFFRDISLSGRIIFETLSQSQNDLLKSFLYDCIFREISSFFNGFKDI